MHNIQFDVAEVLDYDRTYKYVGPDSNETNVNELFALSVRSCSKYFNQEPILAKPSDIHIKKIPVVGEFVLIYKTINEEASYLNRREVWYYLTTVDLQSAINTNRLPGVTGGSQQDIDNSKPGKNFQNRIVSPLQPYEGDILFEGRWGNSIRFSSTIDLNGEQTQYSVPVPWKGSQPRGSQVGQGQPIIILSNGRGAFANKKFVAEDIQNDASSLYLTSTQKLPTLILNTNINTGESVSSFSKSQFIGVADRIILKSKTDSIILDSLKSIEINTPLLSVGISSDKENGLHSTETKDILNTILDIIKYGLIAGDSPVTINPALRSIFDQQLLDAFNTIDNKLIKQDKS